MNLEKTCSLCNILKSIDEFHKLKRGEYGRHSHCKCCRSKNRKEYSYERPKKGIMKCAKCSKFKNISDYYTDKSSSTGLQSYCIECHKEKIYESQSKLNGYITKMLNKIKNEKNSTITKENYITNEDVLELYLKQDKKCALTGELLSYYNGPQLTENSYESRYNICIDRIDKNKGYAKENIILIGKIVSKMKSNIDMKSFIHLCSIISEKNKINI
jgi:hypothetical protein